MRSVCACWISWHDSDLADSSYDTRMIDVINLWAIDSWVLNRPLDQSPQCTWPISHNVLFCNRNVHTCAHFCYKMVHCGICLMHCGVWDGAVCYLRVLIFCIFNNFSLLKWWRWLKSFLMEDKDLSILWLLMSWPCQEPSHHQPPSSDRIFGPQQWKGFGSSVWRELMDMALNKNGNQNGWGWYKQKLCMIIIILTVID